MLFCFFLLFLFSFDNAVWLQYCAFYCNVVCFMRWCTCVWSGVCWICLCQCTPCQSRLCSSGKCWSEIHWCAFLQSLETWSISAILIVRFNFCNTSQSYCTMFVHYNLNPTFLINSTQHKKQLNEYWIQIIKISQL